MKIIIHILFLFFVPVITSCNNNGNKADIPNSNSAKQLSIEELKEAVNKYPDSLSLRNTLIDAYLKRSDIKNALAEQTEYVRRDSLNPEPISQLAALQLASGDTLSAISNLRKSIALAPDRADDKVELGFVYANKKDRTAILIADDILNTFIDPTVKTQARYLKGVYYSNVGDKTKALQLFDSCIIYDYTFLDAHIEKGIILYDLKKYDQSIKSFEKVMSISSTNPEPYYWIGRNYEGLGRKEEAIDYYRKTLGLDENFEDAKKALANLAKK
jgi:tetratricopeptide (TPR) repeat protein